MPTTTDPKWLARAQGIEWVLVITGEGASATLIGPGDLHEAVHDAMCFREKPWRECLSSGVTEDVARLDDPDSWVKTEETETPYTICWQSECGDICLYRLTDQQVIARHGGDGATREDRDGLERGE